MFTWMLGNLVIWAVLFFGIPYLGVKFVPSDAGMIFTMVLLLIVYPIYIAQSSWAAAKRKGNTAWLPLVVPVIFVLCGYLVFEEWQWIYAAAYLVIGYVFWGISMSRKKKHAEKKQQAAEERAAKYAAEAQAAAAKVQAEPKADAPEEPKQV